ncbi:MAG TPA: TauD/TfdA family dioxygenase [Acidimicrobiia bacterium]|nr:TauD/TfdA family dioxygenase [Acidimicrobiia bacterium]
MTAFAPEAGAITVERQAGALGAVVEGVDLSADLSDATFELLHDALLEHLVLCIRDQGHITPEHQITFARRWGPIEPHPYVDPIEGHPEIIRVYDPNPITVTWHADFTYAKRPPALSFLLARTIPPVGGDTMFTNCYLAYENLSPGFQETLCGIRAVHYATQLAIEKGMAEDEIVNAHPVVRTHPETNRRLLFVNGNYTRHFEGWTEAESAPVLEYLYSEIGRYEYTYRHRWQPGDLLLWDNRAAQHAVIGDTGGQERSLHRVTVASDSPPR